VCEERANISTNKLLVFFIFLINQLKYIKLNKNNNNSRSSKKTISAMFASCSFIYNFVSSFTSHLIIQFNSIKFIKKNYVANIKIIIPPFKVTTGELERTIKPQSNDKNIYFYTNINTGLNKQISPE